MKKTMIILFGVELILVLAGVIGLFGKPQTVVSRNQTKQFIEEGIALPAGVYTLKVFYEGGGDHPAGYVSLQSDKAYYKGLLSNPVPLEDECQFYLLNRTENLKLVLEVWGEDIQILGAEVISGTAGSRIYLFWLCVILVPLNLVILFYEYYKRHLLPTDKLMVIFGLPVLVIAASLPILVDYNVQGADILFHLQRIEALARSILQGEVWVRMKSFWLRGHGYASSLFYADTLLFIPAALRVLGLDPSAAYRVFLFFINMATAAIAYISTSRCFHSRYVGLLGSVVYTFAPYRLYNLYQRAAVGEATAMIFLPLIVWGLYRIYTEDTDKKGYFWNWVIPTIGFLGVIQTHLLSCEMVAIFVILCCLLLWKKTFQRKRFAVLCCTAGMTILLNAWFLAPCVDMMLSDQYYYSASAQNMIQNRGVYLAQIFYTLQAAGYTSHYDENGMIGAEPIGLGAAMLLCLALWVVIRRLCAKDYLDAPERAGGDMFFGLTIAALFMSTRYFPYDFLSANVAVLSPLIGALQFPTRFTAIASVLGAFLACVICKRILRENNGFAIAKTVVLLIALFACVFGMYQTNDILMRKESPLRLYSARNMGNNRILGAEYLPAGAEISHFDNSHGPVFSKDVELINYGKRGLMIDAEVQTSEDGWIEFPILYYKGYRAYVTETGEPLTIQKGNHCDLRVALPKSFSGNIHVEYAGMWYWRLAEWVSVLSGLGFFVCYLQKRYNSIKAGISQRREECV